jgi:hypothetical protein
MMDFEADLMTSEPTADPAGTTAVGIVVSIVTGVYKIYS